MRELLGPPDTLVSPVRYVDIGVLYAADETFISSLRANEASCYYTSAV